MRPAVNPKNTNERENSEISASQRAQLLKRRRRILSFELVSPTFKRRSIDLTHFGEGKGILGNKARSAYQMGWQGRQLGSVSQSFVEISRVDDIFRPLAGRHSTGKHDRSTPGIAALYDRHLPSMLDAKPLATH